MDFTLLYSFSIVEIPASKQILYNQFATPQFSFSTDKNKMGAFQIRRMFYLNRVANPGESLSRELATRGDG